MGGPQWRRFVWIVPLAVSCGLSVEGTLTKPPGADGGADAALDATLQGADARGADVHSDAPLADSSSFDGTLPDAGPCGSLGLPCCDRSQCDPTTVCLGGSCVACGATGQACCGADACANAAGCCGGSCMPLDASPNCGTCGVACDAGEVCYANACCQPNCSNPNCGANDNCGGRCNLDNGYCGGDQGNGNVTCTNGSCCITRGFGCPLLPPYGSTPCCAGSSCQSGSCQ